MRRELAHSIIADAGAAFLPGSHNAVERARTSHLGTARRTTPHLLRTNRCHFPRDRPQEPDEFARDRHDRDLRPLPIRQMVEAPMQPLLRLPGMRDHRGRLAGLPSLEVHARLRTMPVAPRRLNEQVATMTIARFVMDPSRWRAPLESSREISPR